MRSLKLRLESEGNTNAHALRGIHVETDLVIADPDDRLIQRPFLKRPWRIVTKHPAGKMANDLSLMILDYHRDVAGAFGRKHDLEVIVNTRDAGLSSELENRLPFDLKLAGNRGRKHAAGQESQQTENQSTPKGTPLSSVTPFWTFACHC